MEIKKMEKIIMEQPNNIQASRGGQHTMNDCDLENNIQKSLSGKLHTSIAVFWINTCCTLKCKNCITLTPYHQKPMNIPKEIIFRDIDNFFKIYEWADHFDIEGGESLLHPDLAEIIEKALEYRNCYKRIHILTNGTLLPSDKLLKLACDNQIFFIVDDYGKELSVKKQELCELLEHWKVPYRVDTYCGEEQYCGGWIDFGDMSKKNYSLEEEQKVFLNCRAAYSRAFYVKNGALYFCPVQGANISHIPLMEGEYVRLSDPDIPLDEKIKTASLFGTKPIAACSYCKGFDAEHGKRIKAAEQITSFSTERKNITCL